MVLVLGFAACHAGTGSARAGDIAITGAYSFAPLAADEGSAYFTIRNEGTSADTLLRIETPWAKSATLHDEVMAGQSMRMEALTQIEIPPAGAVTLKPGGKHLMIMEFSHSPKPGEILPLTLEFAHAGQVSVQAPVYRYGDAP